MPRFQQMMNSFALDERAGKNCAKFRRARARLEALDINAARQIEKFFFGKILRPERFRRLFREHDHEIRELVFLKKTFPLQEKARLPFCERAGRLDF